MSATLPVFMNVPPVASGYPIDGDWSVIVPIARTNEVLNPSLEGDLVGYTAGTGVLARTTAKQYHGVYSASYVPTTALTDGFYYGTISTTSGQFRAISCKFLGQPNVKYALTLATTGGVDLVANSFKGTGRWQWIWLYYLETSSTTRRIYFRKDGSNDTHTFYVDGVQSEVINTGELVSTYIDGDQQGFLPNQAPAPYLWNGTPHASTSSRSALTRAGGYVVPFKKYGFIMLALVGLGLPSVHNVSTEYALLDGGYPSYTRKPISQFTISGYMSEVTYATLRGTRGGLGRLFDRDTGGLDQTMLLHYHHTDSCDNISSDTVAIPCKYVSGLEGQTNNHNAQMVNLQFETYLPSISANGNAGTTLTPQTTVTNANGVLRRSSAGVWSAMGTGVAAAETVEVMLAGRDGTIYAGGLFATMGGIANASKIAKWSPTTQVWTAMGTGGAGAGNKVFALAQAPNGDIIAAGNFTSMGGVANTANLAKWVFATQTWASITPTPANNSVLALGYDSLGNLYVGGSFTAINGVAAAGVAKFDGTTWTALGTGVTGGAVNTLLVDKSDNVIFGGSFTAAGGVGSTGDLAKWTPLTSLWSALGGGLTGGAVRALAFDNIGGLYVGGDFTASGSVSLIGIARFNGTALFPVSTGVTPVTTISELNWNSLQNLLYVGGTFTSAGGLTLPDSLTIWNTGAFTFPDVDLPGSAQVNAIIFGADGTMYLGYDTRGSATAGSTTTFNNPGTARSYPTIVFNGPTSGAPARVWSLINTVTGKALYFNYLMNVGERAILTLQPDNISFASNVQGDITGRIVPGSNVSDFYLQPSTDTLPGTNAIAMLSASSTITTNIYWQPAYSSLDDLQ